MTPQAIPEAPSPTAVLSTTATSAPEPSPRIRSSRARCHAVDRPCTPAPTTTYRMPAGTPELDTVLDIGLDIWLGPPRTAVDARCLIGNTCLLYTSDAADDLLC